MLKPSFKSDVQKAFGYAIYMIADSYWDETTVGDPKETKELSFNYAQLNLKKQYKMEKLAILFMDKVASHLPEKFFKKPVTVCFGERNKGKDMVVRFYNDRYVFSMAGHYNEEKPVIRYKLTKR